MASNHTKFWLALLTHHKNDKDQRIRLWNGYLGLMLPPRMKGDEEPQNLQARLIYPPEGGWPELTKEDHATIEALAQEHGGHPEFDQNPHNYMDFSKQSSSSIAVSDLSGLIFVGAIFDKVYFLTDVTFSNQTRFYFTASFQNATFQKRFSCQGTRFNAQVWFSGSRFMQFANFWGAKFMGGASFNDVMFEEQVMFNDSRFEERYFPKNAAPLYLADFRNAKFMSRASFREVHFGSVDSTSSRLTWPERRADFTDAEFTTTTSFRGAFFGGAPAFFNTKLHDDTDFGGIDWDKTSNANNHVDYTIRAWERLELMMSKLEKPFERHQFFRLKCEPDAVRTVFC